MNIWVDANGWPIPPTILLGCLVIEVLYLRGWGILLKEIQAKQSAKTITLPAFAGFKADDSQRKTWLWRGACFVGAIFALLLASYAPIDNLAGRYFWVHMIQHLLLLIVMAPLLVAGAPLIPLWLGLPAWLRRRIQVCAALKVGRTLCRIGQWLLLQPAIACVLLIIGLWVWHWPPLYDLALTNDTIHDWCEHLTFMAVSVLFWAQVIPAPPLRPRLGYLGRLGVVGIAIAQNVVLAVLIAFAPAALYAPYAHLATLAGGLTALQDQQIGAGIMWTFGDLPFGITISILLHQWLTSQSGDTEIVLPSQSTAER